MPFAALTYPIRKGHDRTVAEIFSAENFRRVDSPAMIRDGSVVGFLVATALFLQDGTIVRVIQHEGGTTDDVGRHMAAQDGVHEAERALMPYLPEPRDTETAAGFREHFDRSLLVELDQQAIVNRPAPAVLALRYPVQPGNDRALRDAYAEGGADLDLEELGVERTAVFLRPGEFVLRVFQHEPGRTPVVTGVDDWLDPFRTGDPGPVEPMRSVSFLSAATASRS